MIFNLISFKLFGLYVFNREMRTINLREGEMKCYISNIFLHWKKTLPILTALWPAANSLVILFLLQNHYP